MSINGRFNAVYTLLCVWCGFKELTFSLHEHFFFSFLSVGKNILEKYLRKFADIKYLRIFVENIKTKNNENI